MNVLTAYLPIVWVFALSIGNPENGLMADELQVNSSASASSVDALLDQAEEDLNESIDLSLKTARAALAEAENIDYQAGAAKANNWIARMLTEKGDTEGALVRADEARQLFSSLNDSINLARVFNTIGIIYKKKDDLQNAIVYQYRATALAEQLGNMGFAVVCYNSLGNLYSQQRDYKNAINFYSKAIPILEEGGKTRSLAGLYLNMANIVEGRNEKMSYFNKAIDLGETYGYNRTLGYAYCGLALEYSDLWNNPDSSAFYHNLAIVNSEKAGDAYMVAYNRLYLGVLRYENGDFSEAKKLLEASAKNEYIRDDLDLYADNLFYLAQTERFFGRHATAFTYLDSALVKYKKRYDQSLVTEAQEAAARFESEKKEAEIARQELVIERQKNTRNTVVGGSILGLALLSALFFGFYQRFKRKRREAELAAENAQQRAANIEDLSRMKTTLFNNISHELRTPLTLIIAPLKDALARVNNVQIKGDLSIALRNGQRLLGLTNEIMDLSKLDAGKLTVEKKSIFIRPFFFRVINAFESLATSRSILLKAEIGATGEDVVEVDTGKLESVLNNLIANAIKYSLDHSTVKVRLLSESLELGVLSVEVEDQGVGIPPEDFGRIFDRFYQSSRTSQSSGTGIGLSLVKELCMLMGGSIDVKSNPAQGSTFSFSIPVAKSKKKSSPEEVDEVQAPLRPYTPFTIHGKKPRILIVEDDSDMSRYLKKIFHGEYRCDVAYNGRQALDMIHQKSYDLISSDVMMPEMDGLEFKKLVNDQAAYRQIPFIMLSARVLEEDKLKALHLGIDDYITKPFSTVELKARVHNLLRNKAVRLEMEAEEQEITYDVGFVQSAEELVLQNIDLSDFKVKDLAAGLNYSERQLGRLLKKFTGLNSVEFILEIRLQKAHRLIVQRQYATLNEIKYEVGIDSSAYFSRKFKERFGVSPSELEPVEY